MNKYNFLFLLLSINLYSCIYKAGNRQPDINQGYDVSISPFYIKKYMRSLDSFYMNRNLITSEVVNYPEDFIPITDSTNGYKYIIEFDNFDSLKSINRHYINLASIYDFKRQKWIKDIGNLKESEWESFKDFFKNSILNMTVNRYKGHVPDSFLFIDKSQVISIKELR
jgi:hypothetical protein